MKKAETVLRELEGFGKKEFLPAIGPTKGKVLSGLIKDHGVKKVLEIGCLYGYSAILMGKEVDSLVSLEIDERHVSMATSHVEKAGLSSSVKVIHGNALDVIPTLPGKFDLLFIDGAKREYLEYLRLGERLLKKGSLVVADNVGIFEDAMQDYLEYVRNSGKYASKTVEVALGGLRSGMDAMEISVKK